VRDSNVFGFAALLATLHDRQPVILTPEQEEAWLDPQRTDPVEFIDFFRALPESAMEMEPVSALVGDANNRGPEVRRRPDVEPQQRTLL
jgi:putative SOS response-associated peptidase YedK